MCLILVDEELRNNLYTKLNHKRIKDINDYLSKKEGILFNTKNEVINDKHISKPYAKFKYFVEGEERTIETDKTEE